MKKAISIISALALVVAMFCTMNITAFASTESITVQYDFTTDDVMETYPINFDTESENYYSWVDEDDSNIYCYWGPGDYSWTIEDVTVSGAASYQVGIEHEDNGSNTYLYFTPGVFKNDYMSISVPAGCVITNVKFTQIPCNEYGTDWYMFQSSYDVPNDWSVYANEESVNLDTSVEAEESITFEAKDGINSLMLTYDGENERAVYYPYVSTIEVTYDKITPEIIDGANQTVKAGAEASFRSDAPFSTFEKVLLDGAELDAANYTATEGSTIITLKADYVKTLAAGKHTIDIVSTSGTASTEFTIEAAQDETTKKDDSTKSPATGATMGVATLTAGLGLWVVSRKRR